MHYVTKRGGSQAVSFMFCFPYWNLRQLRDSLKATEHLTKRCRYKYFSLSWQLVYMAVFEMSCAWYLFVALRREWWRHRIVVYDVKRGLATWASPMEQGQYPLLELENDDVCKIPWFVFARTFGARIECVCTLKFSLKHRKLAKKSCQVYS